MKLIKLFCLLLVLMSVAAGGREKQTKSLHQAAADGNLEQVKSLISKGTDLNAKDEKGRTALHLAAEQGQRQVAEILITGGAGVNPKDKDGFVPLHFAASEGDKEMADLLIARGADVNAKDKWGWTPLGAAAYGGHKHVVELLVSAGANVNSRYNWGQTPLIWAAQQGHSAVVELLIANGADVNAKDKRGYTPLHCAIWNEDKDTVRLLVAKGADVNTKGVLHNVAAQGHKDLIELFIAKGADANVRDNWGHTPLHRAAKNSHADVADLLLTKGAHVDAKDDEGCTPLHYASGHGDKSVVDLLVDKGADLNAKDKWGRTPLHFALVKGNNNVARLLKDKGAETNIPVMRTGEQVAFGSMQALEALNVETKNVRGDLSVRELRKVQFSFDIEPSDVTIYPAPKGRKYLEIKELKPLVKKGVPQLPVKTFVAKLEKDRVVCGVKIVKGKFAKLARPVDIVPAPGNDPYHNFYEPEKEIYDRAELYPNTWLTYEVGSDNHNKLVFVRLFPVQYNAKRKQVYVLTECKVALYYCAGDSFDNGLKKTSQGYSAQSRQRNVTGIGRTDAVNLIICPTRIQSAASQLRDLHNLEGTKSVVVTTEKIASNYQPAEEPPCKGYKDEPPRSREERKLYNYNLARRIVSYLRDRNMHPQAQYVTLMGDSLLIPPSYYAKGVGTRDKGWMETDFFYSSPDYDFVPNFKVGRLPVDGEREAMHVVNKIKRWHESADWSWFRKVYVASIMGHGYIYKNAQRTVLEPINRGYFDGMDIHVQTLFENDHNLDKQRVEPALSEGGVGFVYILAHGSYPFHPQEPLEYSDRVNLPIVVHGGCGAGAFGNDIDTDRQSRSFGESIVVSKAGGIAFFGSTSIACGYPHVCFDRGKTLVKHVAYCQGVHIEVFNAYHQGEDRLGGLYCNALRSFAHDNWIAGDEDNLRAMLIFVLLGDPALRIPAQGGKRG